MITELSGIMSVSGFEYRAAEKIRELFAPCFDEVKTDRVGNHTLIKKCGREGAPKILIDVHFDEIGMLVSDVLEGGFLRIVNVGGIDPSIMQAADVVVYGKETLRGVVASIPPHLRVDDDGKLPNVDELIVDVGLGYTLDELREIVSIGTPVGFAPCYSEFGEGYMAGKSFDNKACAAIAVCALTDTPREALAGDVYLSLSAREETAAIGGVSPVCFNEDPDYAMVIDVNLGEAPDTPDRETVPMEKGISICFSAATDRALSRAVQGLCESEAIPFTRCVCPSSTGTNATAVNIVGEGIPVVDIGLPLRNMHTYNEVISLEDCQTLYKTVKAFVCSTDIADRFGREVAYD